MLIIKGLSMKIMRFQLCLFIWFQTAATLEDNETDLGQNVTINCDLDVKEIYWLLLKLPHPPVMILRTLSAGPFYYNEQFRHKYSVQSKHHLFINNVTYDELGVYYCVNTGTTGRKFSNGTRLNITDSKRKECQTCTTQWLVIMSGLINGVLILVVIGLLKVFVCGSKRQNPKTIQEDLQQFQDSDHTQYAEVIHSTPLKPAHLNSTYALVQLPKPQTFADS